MYTEWERNTLRRTRLAAAPARALVAELLPGRITEDELCARLGPLLTGLAAGKGERWIGPDHFAAAMISETEAAVREAIDRGRDRDAAWHLLTTLAGILPDGLRVRADEAAARLRVAAGGDLPVLPEGMLPAGKTRWARDRYGSRFAILAPFAHPGAPVRWYLWDVDACALQPVTVAAGYHAAPEDALAAWQTAVGPVATGGTGWQEVGDGWLLEELLPAPEVIMALGGESAAQHAEYHRARRLAEVLLAAPDRPPATGGEDADPAAAADRFLAWRAGRGAGSPDDEDGERAAALAEIWPSEVSELYLTCSPHRVAHVAGHVRAEFGPGFAAGVLALLPDWITWLAGSTGLAPDLVERALAYARRDSGPAPDPMARVAE